MIMELNFSGQQVVITGATGALGGAVLDLLVKAGASCHAPVSSERSGARIAAPSVSVRPVDLTDEKAVQQYYDDLPGLHASIHCVGAFAAAPVAETSLEMVRQMLDANTVAAFLCSREAVRRLLAAGKGGRIVNVAARPALEPSQGAGKTAYTLSKAAVAGFTVALAEEVAGHGIWVNAVAPSTLDTPANRAAMPGADFSRWPGVAEVAATIAFLASPANRTTRGALVPVYGRA
jgi:NAD(P)-dependent dehydrogenase (short-subunit alcohol dehydrogenase family)